MSQVSNSSQFGVVLPETRQGDTATPALWIKVGILVALVGAVFWSSLWRLWSKTNPIYGEGNWGHSIIVPLIGLYYLYLNREELAKAPIVPSLPQSFGKFRLISSIAMLVGGAIGAFLVAPMLAGESATYLVVLSRGVMLLGALVLLLNWGVGSLVFGLLVFGYGIWPGQNDYVKDLGLVVTIFGIVLSLCGWHVMKVAWFPIFFLICALPWPGLVYSRVAGPLQELAATVAVFVLQLTGVDATQTGTKIIMEFGPLKPPRMLNVAEACAGLRSLMTFITLGAAVAFLSGRPLWQKIFITFSAIPIAILCNVMRVSGQGLLDVYVSQELAEGFAHQFVGLIMLIPAFFMLLGVAALIDKLFVEEVDAESMPVLKNKRGAKTMKRSISSSETTSPATPQADGGASQA